MDKPMNVCVLVGSLRKASFNGMMANALISLAPSSMKLEIVEIGQLPLYNEDLETDAGGPTCYDGVLSAEIDAFDYLSRGRARSKVRCDPLHGSISPLHQYEPG